MKVDRSSGIPVFRYSISRESGKQSFRRYISYSILSESLLSSDSAEGTVVILMPYLLMSSLHESAESGDSGALDALWEEMNDFTLHGED